MKVLGEYILRKIAGDYVIIPSRKTTSAVQGLLTLNEVEAELWQILQKEVTFDEMLRRILEMYDVDENTAKEDIQDFLDILTEAGILDKSGEQ